MNIYSQVGQDRFAVIVNRYHPGFFIDIGCAGPEDESNVKMLLEKGWTGFGIDINDHVEKWKDYKGVKVIQGNSITQKWDVITNGLTVNYISFDANEDTTETIKAVLSCGVNFLCATVEHDFYSKGDEYRPRQREMLLAGGFKLVRADVAIRGLIYEDWWIHESVQELDQIDKDLKNDGL